MAVESVETVAPVREVIGQDDKGRDLVMYGGKLCRVCSNGALQDAETGKLVRPPTPDQLDTIRTTERAQELNYARWHGNRQEALRGAVERATGAAMPDILNADAAIIADMVEGVVLNVDVRADHRVKAAQWVYEQSGMDGRAPKQTQNAPGAGIQINIGADVAAQMMAQLMQQAQNRGILDAE